ncbi:hypothetical protein T06_1065 [Trichinella sp. T6]|nr:hypothetical protein T06_1065 [Trichinella sp. T6]
MCTRQPLAALSTDPGHVWPFCNAISDRVVDVFTIEIAIHAGFYSFPRKCKNSISNYSHQKRKKIHVQPQSSAMLVGSGEYVLQDNCQFYCDNADTFGSLLLHRRLAPFTSSFTRRLRVWIKSDFDTLVWQQFVLTDPAHPTGNCPAPVHCYGSSFIWSTMTVCWPLRPDSCSATISRL